MRIYILVSLCDIFGADINKIFYPGGIGQLYQMFCKADITFHHFIQWSVKLCGDMNNYICILQRICDCIFPERMKNHDVCTRNVDFFPDEARDIVFIFQAFSYMAAQKTICAGNNNIHIAGIKIKLTLFPQINNGNAEWKSYKAQEKNLH